MARTRTAALPTAFALVIGLLVAPAVWAAGPMMGGQRQMAPSGPGMPPVAPAGAQVARDPDPTQHPQENRQRRHRQVPEPQQPGLPDPHHFGPSYPFGYNYRGPSYPFGNSYYRAPAVASPVYVAPRHRERRWVPGYWDRQWVPQYSYYEVFVPGYFTATGLWIQGYYETQAAEAGGYYQPVWVDGYWTE